MKLKQLIPIFAAAVLWGGCANGPREPMGEPVELTQEDLSHVRFAQDEKERWAAWQTKGTRLVKAKSYEQALYCFNQAIKTWPKKIKGVKDHQPEPTETLLQKAYLFLKMNEPELAVKYFKRFEHYMPGNNFSAAGIKQAEAMLQAKKVTK